MNNKRSGTYINNGIEYRFVLGDVWDDRGRVNNKDI